MLVKHHASITSNLLFGGFMMLLLIFAAQLLIFLVNYHKHLFGQPISAIATLTR